MLRPWFDQMWSRVGPSGSGTRKPQAHVIWAYDESAFKEPAYGLPVMVVDHQIALKRGWCPRLTAIKGGRKFRLTKVKRSSAAGRDRDR